jgi:hypothetical protein
MEAVVNDEADKELLKIPLPWRGVRRTGWSKYIQVKDFYTN